VLLCEPGLRADNTLTGGAVLRDWLRRKEIDAFAAALAQDMGRRFPPRSEARTDKGAANQLKAITGRLCEQAREFHRQRRLGVYGKAKLGNSFRWQLKELGYSQAIIEQVTHELVLNLAK
jgi:hypothetical protein